MNNMRKVLDYGIVIIILLDAVKAGCDQSSHKKCHTCTIGTCGNECYLPYGISLDYLGDCYFRKVHGVWSNWKSWSYCTATCGYGTRSRSRSCNNPSPKHDGRTCSDSWKETNVCTSNPYCENCNIAKDKRVYNALLPTNSVCLNAGLCFEKDEYNRKCYMKKIHGNWSPWQQWSACSMTCGYGTRERERTCNNPPPKYEGSDCNGDLKEIQVCDWIPTCQGCDVFETDRSYLHNTLYPKTQIVCKQLGYCWDRENFPMGKNCYKKKFPKDTFFEEKKTRNTLKGIKVSGSHSKLQCIMKCKNNNKCKSSGFVPSPANVNTGTCLFLQDDNQNNGDVQEIEQTDAILFSNIQP